MKFPFFVRVGARSHTWCSGQWVACPPISKSQGAEEFFSASLFVREHLLLTKPPSMSNDSAVTLRSINNYASLLQTRKCM
jgi:hypothetical protein